MLLMLPGAGRGLAVRQARVLDKSLPWYWLLSSGVAPPTSKVFITSGCRSPRGGPERPWLGDVESGRGQVPGRQVPGSS